RGRREERHARDAERDPAQRRVRGQQLDPRGAAERRQRAAAQVPAHGGGDDDRGEEREDEERPDRVADRARAADERRRPERYAGAVAGAERGDPGADAGVQERRDGDGVDEDPAPVSARDQAATFSSAS